MQCSTADSFASPAAALHARAGHDGASPSTDRAHQLLAGAVDAMGPPGTGSRGRGGGGGGGAAVRLRARRSPPLGSQRYVAATIVSLAWAPRILCQQARFLLAMRHCSFVLSLP